MKSNICRKPKPLLTWCWLEDIVHVLTGQAKTPKNRLIMFLVMWS